MDVVVIFNGLGNQMSQYAFYLAKKRHSPKTVAIFDYGNAFNHNGYELEKLFGIRILGGLIARLLLIFFNSSRYNKHKIFVKLFKLRTFREPRNYDFTEEMLRPGPFGINFYWGGWHSEQYFKPIEREVNDVFRFPLDSDTAYARWQERICGAGNSVSLHVRRGDYVNISPDDYYQFGGVATLEYYRKAIDYLREAVGKCSFFVFSDDIPWCREQFGDEGMEYVDCNSGQNSWRDMCLMTMCKHHINANSTFSWWGAWLNADPDGIVVRPRWFIRDVVTEDFYPENWHVL